MIKETVDKIVFVITNEKGRPFNYKIEIDEELEMGGDYTILLKGRVFKKEILDNLDGTVNYLYKLAVPDLDVQLITASLNKEIIK